MIFFFAFNKARQSSARERKVFHFFVTATDLPHYRNIPQWRLINGLQ